VPKQRAAVGAARIAAVGAAAGALIMAAGPTATIMVFGTGMAVGDFPSGGPGRGMDTAGGTVTTIM
jgi:hypothetical protein